MRTSACDDAARRDRGTGIVQKAGFDFGFDPGACAACGGRCCRGRSGRVWVNATEIAQIVRFLGANPVDFMAEAVRRVDNRLSLRERPDGEGFRCIFLEGGSEARCGIYPVRPLQCRAFPFWDPFRRRPPTEECPGIRKPA